MKPPVHIKEILEPLKEFYKLLQEDSSNKNEKEENKGDAKKDSSKPPGEACEK